MTFDDLDARMRVFETAHENRGQTGIFLKMGVRDEWHCLKGNLCEIKGFGYELLR